MEVDERRSILLDDNSTCGFYPHTVANIASEIFRTNAKSGIEALKSIQWGRFFATISAFPRYDSIMKSHIMVGDTAVPKSDYRVDQRLSGLLLPESVHVAGSVYDTRNLMNQPSISGICLMDSVEFMQAQMILLKTYRVSPTFTPVTEVMKDEDLVESLPISDGCRVHCTNLLEARRLPIECAHVNELYSDMYLECKVDQYVRAVITNIVLGLK